MLTTISSRQ